MNDSLDNAALGEKVRVVKLAGNLPLRKRLLEMGILPGVAVTVIKAAPFGDPLEIKVKGANILLRRREAAMIKVEKIK